MNGKSGWGGWVAVLPAVVLGIQAANPATREVAELTIPLPGSGPGIDPLAMVLIRAGTFQMGCPADERGRVGREWLPHQVTLTRPFYLGRHEITQGQWEAVMGTQPAHPPGVGSRYPVHDITWNESVGFIRRLNTLGLGAFRLPTEAEWEYACRAGTTNRFSFGDALECSDVREPCDLLSLHLWWGGNNGKGGQPRGCKPVGLKLPNPWGLHDVHGNVWEWCSDGWEMPTPRGSQTDPHGPHETTLRVMRGGAWESHALHLRSADRSPMGPEDREYGRLIGLRIVREAP